MKKSKNEKSATDKKTSPKSKAKKISKVELKKLKGGIQGMGWILGAKSQ